MRPDKAAMRVAGVLACLTAWVSSSTGSVRIATAAAKDSPAAQSSPAAEAEGRKHARKANHLADINRCKLAIAEYGKALRLLKDSTLFFNRAECYRRTGESAKAVADYRKFLIDFPTAPNRPQVETQIAVLEKSSAPSSSSSSPPPPDPAPPRPLPAAAALTSDEAPAPVAMAVLDRKPDPAPAAEPAHGSSHWLVWVVGAVVVAGGAAGAYLVLSQGKTDIPPSALGNYKF
jgi:hypothetical protein